MRTDVFTVFFLVVVFFVVVVFFAVVVFLAAVLFAGAFFAGAFLVVSTGFAAGASTTAFTGVSALTSAAVVLTSAFTVSVFGAAFAAALDHPWLFLILSFHPLPVLLNPQPAFWSFHNYLTDSCHNHRPH